MSNANKAMVILGAIDHGSPVPYYHQLKELIQDEVASGRWPPGTRIPSEPQLCEMLDVSRTVVRQALGELVSERILRRQKGLGTFVSAPKISGRLVQSLTGFYDDMIAQGLQPRTKVLSHEVVATSQTVAERLRSVSDEPICLVTTFLPHELCAKLERFDLTDRSLYGAMAELCGLRLAYGRRMLEAISASASARSISASRRAIPFSIYAASVTWRPDDRSSTTKPSTAATAASWKSSWCATRAPHSSGCPARTASWSAGKG
jgi:GntR family transcriptional regulator